MEDKHNFGDRLNEFIVGKGFYIVLLLCVCLIAASIWLLTSESDTVREAGKTETSGELPTGALPVMKTETALLPSATPLPPNVPVMAPPEAPATAQALHEPEETGAETEEAVETEEIVYGLTDYYIWPVNGRVDRPYSLETLSYDATMGDWRLHAALDIAAAEGTAVLASTNGTVAAVYNDRALGSVVEIDHGDGVRSVYANLSPELTVHAGEHVQVGDQIGTVGHSAVAETAEAPHLHFAITVNGQSVDPCGILPEQ